MVVCTPARSLALGRLGDPGKVPRIGHEKPKLWDAAAYRLLWSVLGLLV